MKGCYNIMIIEFRNNKIKTIYLNADKARKKYGIEIATKIILRINQLQAFDNLCQVPYKPPFRRHKLKGEYDGCFPVDILNGFRLIFKPIIRDREISFKMYIVNTCIKV
jgi:plasmid maintenance system killer protein